MIKKYKCNKCEEVFNKEFEKENKKISYKKGKLYDFNTGKELIEPEVICPKCKGNEVTQMLNGMPTASYPIDDLTFSVSKKRMADGLYHDQSHKTTEKAKELKDTMQYKKKDD